MNSARKNWAEQDRNHGAGLTDVLASRYEQPEPQSESTADSPTPEKPAKKSPAKPKPSQRTPGTTRSWFLPQDVADELAMKADELYFDMRGKLPKHAILGALIRHGLKHESQARKELERQLPME